MMTISEKKAALRKTIRSHFPGDAVRAQESAAVCGHILACDWYRDAACVAAYVPMRREADVMPVLADALASGKTMLLPRVTGEGVMQFHRVSDLMQLEKGSFGILEPRADLPVCPVEEAALLLVPLEGVDERGYRLGKGGGYYDRMLPQYPGVTLGVVMSWQWTDAVPTEPWDCRLMAAADRNGIWLFEEAIPKKG